MIESTVARKSFTFNSWLSLEHHTFINWLSTFHAIALRTLKSVSEAFTHDLRYLKSSTFLSSTFPMVFSGSSGKLKVKYSVFFRFRRNPTVSHYVSTLFSSSCDCTIPSDIRAMSSSKSRSVSITGWILRLSLGVIPQWPVALHSQLLL